MDPLRPPFVNSGENSASTCVEDDVLALISIPVEEGIEDDYAPGYSDRLTGLGPWPGPPSFMLTQNLCCCQQTNL